MINLVEGFKKNYKKVIISFLSFFIFHTITRSSLSILTGAELYPGIGLYPVIGLLFGPWGALGISLANALTDISAGYTLNMYVPGFFADFISAYLPYKLWYTMSKGEKVSTPKLNSVYNLFKFLGIILITSIIYSSLIMILFANSGIDRLFSITALEYILNIFTFGFILGLIIIIVANIKKFKFYIPQVNKTSKVNPKFFNLSFLISLILIVLYFLYFNHGLFGLEYVHSIGIILQLVIFLLLFIYLLKPINKEIIIKKNFYSSLIERIILIFLAFTLLFISFFAIAAYDDLLREITQVGWSLSILFYMDFALFIFYLPGIVVLAYVEKKITTPIEIFASSAKKYINSNSFDTNYKILDAYSNYVKENSEIGDLAVSFTKMIKDLEEYMETLKRVTAEKERIAAELDVAKKIQESTLPKDFPNNNNYEIYASMTPAREVGGDFYDFFEIDDNQVAIVIGDASGKGMPAALFAVIAKSLIKNQLQLGNSPSSTFINVNKQLCDNNEASMFVTAWAGVLEINSGKLTFVNAGHNSPLIKKSSENYEWLNFKHDLVLGGFDDFSYHEYEIKLNKGDKIYLYTDGVTEAHNINNELFSDDYLIKVINEKNFPPKELIDNIYIKINEFKGEADQFDDITMLSLDYKR